LSNLIVIFCLSLMAYNDEHIFQLILEKLSGAISDENRLYLEQAAREDENIRRCIEEMEDAARVAGPGFMDDVYNELAWSNVLSLLDNEQQPATRIITAKPVPEPEPLKINSARPWWIAAATITVLSSLVYFFFSGTGKPGNTIAKQAITIPLKGNIQLILDNGDTLPLPGSEEKISALLQEDPHLPADAWGTLLVPAGKDYQVTLTDGSAIHLNSFSSLRFPLNFTDKTREVFLSGEAFFSIAPDAQQSFVVHSGPTAVKVLGTAFNIKAYHTETTYTTLLNGAVKVADQVLKPGQMAISEEGYTSLTDADVEQVMAWKNKQIILRDANIRDIMEELSRWYNVDVQYASDFKGATGITIEINRNVTLSKLLEMIMLTKSAKFKTEGNTVTVMSYR